jgi:hypothetical protein
MVNPFEPPRAADAAVPALDGQPASAMPEAAVVELVTSVSWVRWAARLALVSAVVGLASCAVTLAKASQTSEKVGAVAGVLFGVPVSVLYWLLFQRYAGHLQRLGDGRSGALPGALDAQRALLKTFGILTIVLLALVPLAILGAVVIFIVTKGGH